MRRGVWNRRPRPIPAPFAAQFSAMARPRTTQLRESREAAPLGARVIDAEFTVVRAGKRKRTLLDKVRFALAAIAIAAVAGFSIPPAVLLAQAAFGAG